MSVPPPSPPIPPPVKEPARKFNLWTYSVIFFMLIIGGAILIAKVPNFNANGNGSTPTPDRVAAQATSSVLASNATPRPSPTPNTIKVYITGAIAHPGVYIMRTTDRIEDLVVQAGGFTPDSDTSRLNLAVRLQDEMQVVVPARATPGATPPPGGITLAPDSVANQATATKGKGATPTRTPGKMNINTASAADLESLPGIGEVLAARIVEYRTKNGPFKTLNDLKKVQGVTNATLDKIKELITF